MEKGINNLVQEAEKQILTPPPLRAVREVKETFLNSDQIIKLTNIQREKMGLLPIKENAKLDLSSLTKVKDMFEKQYFEHNSPSGAGVKDLAESVGYEFIIIGENLALGNFESDEAFKT